MSGQLNPRLNHLYENEKYSLISSFGGYISQHLDKLISDVETIVTEHLQSFYESQINDLKEEHMKKIDELKQIHDKAMDAQTTSLSSFTLVQSMSSNITDLKRKLEIADDQIKFLKKQINESRAFKSVEEDNKHMKPITAPVSSELIEPILECVTETSQAPPNETIAPKIDSHDLVVADKEIAITDEVFQKKLTKLSKIKVKNQVFYLNKIPESNGECLIYEYCDGKVGQLVGRRTIEGKYKFIKS